MLFYFNVIFYRGHEEYGLCQFGTSGVILGDDSMVVGSPGAYTWRGTTFATSISSDFLARDKTVYYSPVLDHEATVDKYSYLGIKSNGLNSTIFGQSTFFINSIIFLLS